MYKGSTHCKGLSRSQAGSNCSEVSAPTGAKTSRFLQGTFELGRCSCSPIAGSSLPVSRLKGEPREFLHKTQGFIKGKFNATKHIGIHHVRNMEENWKKYIEANPEAGSEQCDMQPDFIKSILRTSIRYK
jgi:hypothetical protein